MAYTSFAFQGFGKGLNLADKPDAVDPGECIDALNVLFTDRGAITQRDGYDNFTSAALTNRPASLEPYYKTDGTRQLLAGCGTRLEALNISGGVVASASALTDGTWDFARFGSPGSEVAYAGNGKNLLRKWDGAAWTSVANSPKARYLSVLAVDQGNRLVAAGFDDSATAGPTASQAYTSRVWFSNAGAPETWGANNYVDLTPGDGENIQGVVVWGEFCFVFKETKFFRFYGTSTDSLGNPVFAYETIDTGIGLASPRAVALGRDGVYFMDRAGLYRTTGGTPERLSDLIEPLWLGGESNYYQGGIIAHSGITNCAMTYHQERVYLAYPTVSANNRVLVYDPAYNWFSLYDIPASVMTVFRIGSQPEMVFGYASGSNHVGRHSSSYSNDDGIAITSRWRSGWFDLGMPDVKRIRETKIWGTGKPFMGVSPDFYEGLGSLDLLDFTEVVASTWSGSTWGGGAWAAKQALTQRLRRRAVRGTTFSTSFYNATLDQSWAAHRMAHHITQTRQPTVVTA